MNDTYNFSLKCTLTSCHINCSVSDFITIKIYGSHHALVYVLEVVIYAEYIVPWMFHLTLSILSTIYPILSAAYLSKYADTSVSVRTWYNTCASCDFYTNPVFDFSLMFNIEFLLFIFSICLTHCFSLGGSRKFHKKGPTDYQRGGLLLSCFTDSISNQQNVSTKGRASSLTP